MLGATSKRVNCPSDTKCTYKYSDPIPAASLSSDFSIKYLPPRHASTLHPAQTSPSNDSTSRTEGRHLCDAGRLLHRGQALWVVRAAGKQPWAGSMRALNSWPSRGARHQQTGVSFQLTGKKIIPSFPCVCVV